jgi:hypothetical protein
MNVITFWSQVWQARRQLRLYQHLLDEASYTKTQRLRRILLSLAGWGLPPALALPSVWKSVGLPQAATFLINAGRLPFLVLFLGAFMLLFSSALHPLLLNSFEALWTPSRRALYMARLLG